MATEPAVVPPSTAFWRTLTRYESAKVVPEIAVRNTIGFAAAIILGTIFGSPSAGVLAGIGALNVSYSDGRDPYVVRARRMLISAALCAAAVTLGALSGHSNATAVITATLWAFASGMLVALGTTAGDLGVITLVTVVVFAARPLPPLEAVEAGLTAFGGALLLILLSIALWPIRRYEPERRIISSLYDDLAKMVRYPAPPLGAPPLTSQITSAHEALALLGQDHSEEAERLVFLLNQAE
ncbi:MAG TPA: FUSC family membrane protein, partial [Bryobacteraceae bacterium]|nr:FUSC family membrane protein [Bryobacteraceae bacterium]